MTALGEIKDDIKQIKSDVQADKADLAALKNKGAGLLVGAGCLRSRSPIGITNVRSHDLLHPR